MDPDPVHYYGTPLQPYLDGNKVGLSSTFVESVAAQLVSPSRGLLIFSPIVLVAVAGLVIALESEVADGTRGC